MAKLLHCPQCRDIRRIRLQATSCECGAVTARYVDSKIVEWNGSGCILGIKNESLEDAIARQQQSDMPSGRGFALKAFVFNKASEFLRIRPKS